MTAETTLKKLLATADIKINGNKPWDIKVNNPKFYQRALSEGDMGLGESYMDGWWDCERLDLLYEKLLNANLETEIKNNLRHLITFLKSKMLNMQNKARSKKVGEVHYDVGNELYKHMLGKNMTYTCAYWKGLKKTSKNLDKAQEQKLDLVCKKMGLKKGMTVLDIGCGWGSFAKFAAKKYKVRVLGITISKEQAKLARKLCKGLPVEIRLQDYRDVKEKFDRIISLGMFEHVGGKNHRTYMEVVRKNLKEDGLFLLHTIGWIYTRKPTAKSWLNKYIFPGGYLPSASEIAQAADHVLSLEDWHDFGINYVYTLRAWYDNFKKSWPKIKKDYDERFYRMWTLYLGMATGAYLSRKSKLWQIVFSKNGVKEGYKSIR